jgi:hypothetical protein
MGNGIWEIGVRRSLLDIFKGADIILLSHILSPRLRHHPALCDDLDPADDNGRDADPVHYPNLTTAPPWNNVRP